MAILDIGTVCNLKVLDFYGNLKVINDCTFVGTEVVGVDMDATKLVNITPWLVFEINDTVDLYAKSRKLAVQPNQILSLEPVPAGTGI